MIRIIVIVMMICMSPSSYAAFHCAVNVKAVLMYANGSVNVRHDARNDYTVICSLKQERLGVSLSTCALWTSTLLNLKKDGRKAIFYYNTASNYNSCATLPTYGNAPAPVYIGDVN